MAHRLDRFHRRLQSTRALLGWFCVVAASTALAALAVQAGGC